MPTAGPATPGLWFDCNNRVTRDKLALMKKLGFIGGIRYLGLGEENGPEDLSAAETDDFMAEEMELLTVQHAFLPNAFKPTPGAGTTYGERAVKNADSAGYIATATIFGDAEGDSTAVTEAAWIQFWNERSAAVFARNDSGLYVGFQCGISSADLFHDLTVNTYMSDAGPRVVPVRGFAIKQTSPSIVSRILGFALDLDWLEPDELGAVPISMHP